MTRRCPRCEGRPELGALETGGVELDFCSTCRGAWVDGEEWTTLFGRPLALGQPVAEGAPLPCPSCESGDPPARIALETRRVGDASDVVLDSCPQCGGAWLDWGEIAPIRKGRASRQQRGPASPSPGAPASATSRSAASDSPKEATGAVPLVIQSVQGPDPGYWRMQLLQMALGVVATLGLALPFVLLGFLPAYFRYHTMKYKFDEEGVGVSHGLLFHSSTYLTYGKIQDIHLRRGLMERWFGLGTVAVQTASGSAAAESTLVGLTDYDAVRDFLYARMRGTKADAKPAAEAGAGEDDVVALLGAVRDEVRELRRAVEATTAGSAAGDGRVS